MGDLTFGIYYKTPNCIHRSCFHLLLVRINLKPIHQYKSCQSLCICTRLCYIHVSLFYRFGFGNCIFKALLTFQDTRIQCKITWFTRLDFYPQHPTPPPFPHPTPHLQTWYHITSCLDYTGGIAKPWPLMLQFSRAFSLCVH